MGNQVDRILYRLGTAAQALDISPETLRQIIRRGELHRIKIGRAVYIRADDLEAFADRQAKAS